MCTDHNLGKGSNVRNESDISSNSNNIGNQSNVQVDNMIKNDIEGLGSSGNDNVAIEYNRFIYEKEKKKKKDLKYRVDKNNYFSVGKCLRVQIILEDYPRTTLFKLTRFAMFTHISLANMIVYLPFDYNFYRIDK